MAYSMLAYTTENFKRGRVKNLSVKITRAENGYMFELEGSKELPITKDNLYSSWETFDATFVYSTLEDGLKEVKGFFDVLEKILDKKVKAQVKANKEYNKGKEKGKK